MKHTPTPWEIGGKHRDCEIYSRGINLGFAREDYGRIDSTTAKANAAHIVKCVNMHDELVEVLSGLMKVYNEPDEEICCNGYHCGCQGASVRQLAEHYARETLKKAGAL